ncbi:MAG TPA: EAL domain-containing protein [Pseudomonas xinjiangensis]|uniref:cyclic-guanylate-specific phosphodiesterase n=2 Tax=root TaxID=1 RepID=A0A7V1BSJ6_9GAMM|nr:EAL domain-containing protein [Halopseudomonas xinjiangensis]HEC47006.1 EAL domain-containing protein [Halopseudomonas xinjiangensis]
MAFPHMMFPSLNHADLRVRQLDLLFEHSRLPQWMVLLTAVAISFVVWNHVDYPVLLGWLLFIFFLALARNQLTSRYRHALPVDKVRLRWRLLFYLGNFCTGLCLAFVHVMLVPLETFALQAPVYGLVASISLCVGIIQANRFTAFVSFVVPAWVPSIIYLLSRDDISSPYWGIMGATLFGCVLLAGAFINRSVLRTMQANDNNIALVTRLDEARQQAEALNQQLTREIQQRRQAEYNLRESHDILEQRVSQRTAEYQQASQALRSSQEQLKLALEASELGLWDWNLESDQVYHSHLEEIFGLPADSVSKMLRDLRPRVHPDDVMLVRETLIEHMKDETAAYQIEYRVKHADGRWLWVEDSGRAVERNDQGQVVRMIGTRRDISARKHQAEQEQLAATVFEATSEGIFILDPQLRILAVNQALSVITGHAAKDIVGTRIREMEGQAGEGADYDEIRQILDRQDRWQGERKAVRRSGEQYPQWLQMAVVRDTGGNITHYIGFFADLTIHRQTEEQVKYLTNYDPLTQLANRSLFTQRLNEALGKARKAQHTVALLHVDLDRFKYINDTLGHSVADTLLQQVATRLGELFPESEALARLSADEFVVIVEEQNDAEQLGCLAGNILERLKRPVTIGDHELVVTASIGISQFPHTARDSLVLIAQANLAMQHAKHLGGNGFQFFTKNLQSYSLERLQLENQLRKAIEESQLVVYYQPKLHLRTDQISSAEALVRWQHPERGLIMPGEFIDMAEETGMIVELGEMVLKLACAQASIWHHEGPTAVCVSVNLSVQQLRQHNFAARVAEILEKTRLPAKSLELELTESMLLEHSDIVAENIAVLLKMGIKLAVDDFGTGYSSLAYLKRFPLHTLKIDRAFVSELDDGGQDAAIVRAIIAMAHSLGLNVVAEGVEHDSQLQFLRNCECDEVQGYLISRPISAPDFTRLLHQALEGELL